VNKNRIILVALAAMLFAMAVPAVAQAPTPELGIGTMDIQIWPGAQQGETVVIASVTIGDEIDLPATVRIPVVPGTTVDWAGEIAGGSPEDDPVREYTIAEGEGAEYAELVLTEFRQGQIESVGIPLQSAGDSFSLSAQWVQSAPATETILSVRLMPGARDANITPAPVGAPARNQAGETLYTLAPRVLEVGETVDISVAYQVGTQFEGGLDGSPTDTLIGVLLAALAVAIVALLWALNRQRRSTEYVAEDDDDAPVASEHGEAVESEETWIDESDEPFQLDDE
jgi:nitrogen fixation-related uncharacterized protein